MAAQLLTPMVADHPVPIRRIEPHARVLTRLAFGHPGSRRVQRDRTRTAHPTPPHPARQEPIHSIEVPARVLGLDLITPPWRRQDRERRQAGPARHRRVKLPRDADGPVQPGLQSARVGARPRLDPLLGDPWDRSTTPFIRGQRGLSRIISTPRPIDRNAMSVRRSSREPQGWPLSPRRRPGNPRRWKTCRSIARTAAGSISCHWSRGGQRGGQDRPRRLIAWPKATRPVGSP